jgi:hypothetical protein
MVGRPMMTRLGPGIYQDAAGAVHVVVPAFLRDHGIPPTPANCTAVVALIRTVVLREFRELRIASGPTYGGLP